MGHLHPTSQNCYALDRMEFLHFMYKILILIAFFSQKGPTAPKDKFLAMPLIGDNFILFELLKTQKHGNLAYKKALRKNRIRIPANPF